MVQESSRSWHPLVPAGDPGSAGGAAAGAEGKCGWKYRRAAGAAGKSKGILSFS